MYFRRNKSARAAAAIDANVNVPQEYPVQTCQDASATTWNYQIDQNQYQFRTNIQHNPTDGMFNQNQYSPDSTYSFGAAPPSYTLDSTYSNEVAPPSYSPDSTYSVGVTPPSAPVYNNDGSVQTPPDSVYNDDKSVDSHSKSKSDKKKDKKKHHDWSHFHWGDAVEISCSALQLAGALAAGIAEGIST